MGWCHSTNNTPSVSLCSTAPPPGSRGPCCPLWGWCAAQRIKIVMIAGGNHTSVSCRDSGKGGIVGNFGLVPFNEQHPLSQPLRAASSPTGEPRPLLPPLGVVRRAANQDSNGNHTSVSCRVSGKGGVVGIFELVPFNEQHPLSQPLRAASSPTGEPRPLLPPPGSRGSLAAPTGEPRFPCCPRWGAERAGGQVQSSVRRKSRILRCLMPLRLISNSSRETTYLGKLSRILSYAPNSRLTVSSEASR